MIRRAFCQITALLLAVAALGLSTTSQAQSGDPQTLATAQALYDSAVKALDKKDYASACPSLEEVVRLVPDGLGAKLTLAECYEGSGRLASAWMTYTLIESAAIKPSQAQHKRTAHKRAEALKPKLAQLTIVVPDAVRALPGLEMTRDGIPVGAAQWGVPLPVDKGKHIVVVSATGKQRLEKTFEIEADGAQKSVEISVLADVVKAAPPPVATGAPVVAPPREDVEAIARRRKIQRTAAFIAGGLGIVGIGLGTGFGIQAIVKKNQSNADDHCHDGDYCDPTGFQLRQDALAASTRSTALFIAGGVTLAAGVTLFLTAPRIPQLDAKVAVGPQGVVVRGAW